MIAGEGNDNDEKISAEAGWGVDEKLKYIAARNERSVNGEIANIIHVYIASFERKYGSIEPPEKNRE